MWKPISEAPKDGTPVYLPVSFRVAAFWDKENDYWVLVQPIHIDFLRKPKVFMPCEK